MAGQLLVEAFGVEVVMHSDRTPILLPIGVNHLLGGCAPTDIGDLVVDHYGVLH